MIRTKGLSHLQLVVLDLDVSLAFYADVFGFEVVHRRISSALLRSPAGGGSLEVRQNTRPEDPTTLAFGLVLQDPGDLEAALDLALASGGHVVSRTEHAVGGASAVVADPDGHRITL